jgi:hypothetical protein
MYNPEVTHGRVLGLAGFCFNSCGLPEMSQATESSHIEQGDDPSISGFPTQPVDPSSHNLSYYSKLEQVF